MVLYVIIESKRNEIAIIDICIIKILILFAVLFLFFSLAF
jgi:hypothetical protein